MIHLTPEQRATAICKELSEIIPIGGTDWHVIYNGIKEAMRDQRHACAEALAGVEGVPPGTHNVVMNAHIIG